MPSWKKVIISGSDAVLNTVSASAFTGSFTGSLFGTASYATTSLSSSYALSASYAPDTTFPYTGSAKITGSLVVTGSANFIGNSINPLFTIQNQNAAGVSAINFYDSASNLMGAFGFANGSYSGTNLQNKNYFYIPKDFIMTPDGTNSYFKVFTSTGEILVNGINSNGYRLDVNGPSTSGALRVSGSVSITGSVSASSFTGSLLGTASYATQALSASYATTASYVLNAVSASYATTASYVLNAISSSFATSASYATTASYVLNAVSASFASTASYINPLNQTVTITGSMNITGSIYSTANITASRALISSSNGTVSGSTLIIYGSGSTNPVFTVQGSQGELFSITDSLSGSLFSVNDISGLPILEVFSDSTTLIGNYQAPALYTTVKLSSISGSNVIYSLPTGSYDGVFVDYTLKSGSNARAGQLMGIWSGSSANYTDNSTTDFGTTTGFTFAVIVSGSNMVVTGSSTTAGWTVKTIIRSI